MAESLEPSLVDFFSDHSLFSIERVEVFTHRVSTRTEFLFVRMIAVEGEIGWGEASFNDLNGQVIVALRILADAIQGSSIDNARNYLVDLPAWKYGRAYQIALSALEQAMADIQSQRLDLPFGALFGSPQRTRIPCYANINRGTTDRSPEGWAKRAQKAILKGFPAIKIAPFDGVVGGAECLKSASFKEGVDIIAAVRGSVNSKIDLMLDCHWKFDLNSAISLLDEVAEYKLAWLEAPIYEDYLAIGDLCKIRRKANESGMKLAGGEYLDGVRATSPFIQSDAYDVINPDIRLCGVNGSLCIAIEADSNGIRYAPHNHLGPIMTAVNLHLMSVAPNAMTLEIQFEEVDIEPKLVAPTLYTPVSGYLDVPNGPGLGVDVNFEALVSIPLC